MIESPLNTHPPRAVLALCLGNICRSPIAEGLLRAHAERSGIQLVVDSAGTSSYHSGEPPDPRSIEVMAHHGYDISDQRSRALTQDDFERFDLILAMDKNNLRAARKIAQNRRDAQKVVLLLHDQSEVPDPYYGGSQGFERVFRMIDVAADLWVQSWHRE